MFDKLLKDADEELYPGCKKFSKPSFLLQLYYLKQLFKWRNESFNALLGLLKEVLPDGEKLPSSYYNTKKMVKGLCLKYEMIHACPNDYMHFRNELANKNINECSHHDERNKDGTLRHLTDSEAWKSFDNSHEKFSKYPRNIRLGLAADGFNPYSKMQSKHSTWPVILMPYNLPPWLCMKQELFILSLLIPGPIVPGNNIDVFLQPLIEELKELWDVGVKTYDAFDKKTFNMKAAIMWTINDFPAYGNLSGWCTYGEFACPSCNINTYSIRLKKSQKYCYMDHRRFLKSNHKYQNDARSFDGTKESRVAPGPISGSSVLNQTRGINFFLGPGKKSKDNLKARLDLKEMNIRPSLWPQQQANGKTFLPPSYFSMSSAEKKLFYEVLENVKLPHGYASNVSHCIRKQKISELKSHDCHVIMQELLPLAL
ncbi:uncharacterized protein LOC107611000 [Arachis ipaensis]|uniref:uncharacterized protein LOC107611000 n=1 Tax=Arachis ipaensis TaxID=130454 RepID=UPI0007AF00D8|nr:uncharacterized protein LOC107611000 [Arachis ipaensis]XP_025670184.1 uncharacterized protein LOC112769959 [Arachis hypogaea]